MDLKNLNRGILNVIAFLCVLILFGTGCRKKDTIIIRYAHVGVSNEPQSLFAEEVARIVNKEAQGRIEIRLYPNSQLGNISELVDGVKFGFVSMSHHDFSSLGKFHKDISVFNAPYIYRDVGHALRATHPDKSPTLAKINAELIENSGIRILGSFFRGTRQLTTNFPVYSIDDLKGKKIRGIPFPIWMSMIRGMGAIPTPVEFSELTTALMTGMVVGQENPLSNIHASRLFEVQTHIAMTNHMYSCLCVFIHEELWQQLEPRDRAIMKDAIAQATEKATQLILKSGERIKQELKSIKNGLEFIDASTGLDVESFRTSVLEQFSRDFPHWKHYVEEIQKVK